jgi:peptide deformylase
VTRPGHIRGRSGKDHRRVGAPTGVSRSHLPMIDGSGRRGDLGAPPTLGCVSVTPIRLMGDPVLRRKAEPVVDFDRELRQLVADLTDTMHAAGGAGLAAPQIGVGLRVFTWYVDGQVGHLVNPDVTPVGEDEQIDPEGCLSIPGFRFDCRRHLYIAATGWDVHGEPVRVEGSHMLARAVQHEVDHLDGVLFVDRLDAEAREAALAVLRDAEWAGEQAYLPAGEPVPTPVVKVSPH